MRSFNCVQNCRSLANNFEKECCPETIYINPYLQHMMDSLPFEELLLQHSLAMLTSYRTPLFPAEAHLSHLDLHHKVLPEVALLLLAQW